MKEWHSLRKLAARRDGYRCGYCGVPTAATIEHVQPRAGDGRSWADNVILACPYCNSRKRDRPVEEFLESGDWKLEHPELPASVKELLATRFGVERVSGPVSTGSTNAKLELKQGVVVLLVRAGKKDDWQRIRLGEETHPRVIAASFDFLARHYTPAKPKRPKPPPGVFAGR